MEVQNSIREFKYNGVALPDPGAQFSLEQVREFYSALYPEIVNAAIEGPTNVGNKIMFEFRRAVGTKGARDRAAIAAKMDAVLARHRAAGNAVPVPARLKRLHYALAPILVRPFGLAPQDPVLPSSAAVPLLP